MAQSWKPRTASRCDGNVAIELGLILPVLLLFTLGIMDAGRLLWTYVTLSRATEAAARCGAVNDTTTCPNISDYAAAQAWGLNDVTSTNFSVSTPACGVQVQANYNFQFIIPWFPQFGPQPFGSANQMALNVTACYAQQF